MKIDPSMKLGAVLVSACCALGVAQSAHAQTGTNPATQTGKTGAKAGGNLEESRTPDSTSANNANGAVGEGTGATNGVAGGGTGRTTKQHSTHGSKHMKSGSSDSTSGAGQ